MMSDRIKTNLEELKKSFPSLDDFSARKLLGGLIPLDHNPDPDPPPSDIGSGNPGRPPSTGSPSGGAVTAGGGDYFGDHDWGNDSWGDGGWGDGGWGDTGPGGDSNPGSSEGGNGQNSSGNPGNEQDSGQLPHGNIGSPFVTSPYDITNSSSERIAVKYGPFNTPIHWVYPGQTFTVPDGMGEIDGINIGGKTYKITDGFGFIEVFDHAWVTNYWIPGSYVYFILFGGFRSTPPNDDWNELFFAVP